MPETNRRTLRKIVLTIFDVTTPDNWGAMKERVKYFAYGFEVCPNTGREHKQAFAYAWKPMRFVTWQSIFPGVHIEPMFGNFRDNDAYCSKAGRLIEYGVCPEHSGVKTSVLAYKRKLEEGLPVEEIAEQEDLFPTYLQYRSGLHEYAQHVRAKRVREDRTLPEVYIRIGPAGTGKTRWLDDRFGLCGWVRVPDNTGKWFDGCDHDVVLFDDVGCGQIPHIDKFKALIDRYPLKLERKGGWLWWKPKVIVITSNEHWNSWWKDISDADRQAIERRITSCTVVE